MRSLDYYRSLNETSKLLVELDVEEVASLIISMNYGVHRLLSAIVRQRLVKRPDDKLASGIQELLEKGLY